MGEDEWLNDKRFATDASRGAHSVLISERMQAWTIERTTAEVIKSLEQARIPWGSVSSKGNLNSPSGRSDGLFRRR